MRKRDVTNILIAVWLLVWSSGQAEPASTPKPPVSKEEVTQAIEAFQRDPTHLEKTGLRLTILQFAEASPDIKVVIGPKPVPWLEDKKVSDEVRASLLTAYIAGNVRSQLEHGAAKNDSVAGCEQVILTYRQLQKVQSGLTMPEIEKLADLQKTGKLAEYLADAETWAPPEQKPTESK